MASAITAQVTTLVRATVRRLGLRTVLLRLKEMRLLTACSVSGHMIQAVALISDMTALAIPVREMWPRSQISEVEDPPA
jgi:hypothetical protein